MRNLVKRLWAMIIGDSYKDFGGQNYFLPHNADKVLLDRKLKKNLQGVTPTLTSIGILHEIRGQL